MKNSLIRKIKLEITPISSDFLKSIENRFQMLLVISFFLPTIFDAFDVNPNELNRSVLNWGIVIAILITSYLLIEFVKTEMCRLVGNILNFLIIVNIICFLPLLYIAARYSEVVFSPATEILASSIVLSMFIPVVILSVLVLQIIAMIDFSNHNSRHKK